MRKCARWISATQQHIYSVQNQKEHIQRNTRSFVDHPCDRIRSDYSLWLLKITIEETATHSRTTCIQNEIRRSRFGWKRQFLLRHGVHQKQP